MGGTELNSMGHDNNNDGDDYDDEPARRASAPVVVVGALWSNGRLVAWSSNC